MPASALGRRRVSRIRCCRPCARASVDTRSRRKTSLRIALPRPGSTMDDVASSQKTKVQRGAADPAPACTLVIFGATGDLTHRLLAPALYNLARWKLLPQDFAIIAVGRKVQD